MRHEILTGRTDRSETIYQIMNQSVIIKKHVKGA